MGEPIPLVHRVRRSRLIEALLGRIGFFTLLFLTYIQAKHSRFISIWPKISLLVDQFGECIMLGVNLFNANQYKPFQP